MRILPAVCFHVSWLQYFLLWYSRRDGIVSSVSMTSFREGYEMATSSLLLFLCTGNYYRSRFAELLFNWQATTANLPWRAESRGIALELGIHNRGPISPHVLSGLRARSIPFEAAVRYPQEARERDFTRAHRIIALDETEHLPLLQQRFPSWIERVEFWQVPDLPRASVTSAFASIETQVQELIRTLSQKIPSNY